MAIGTRMPLLPIDTISAAKHESRLLASRLKAIEAALAKVSDPYVRCRGDNMTRKLRNRLAVLAGIIRD